MIKMSINVLSNTSYHNEKLIITPTIIAQLQTQIAIQDFFKNKKKAKAQNHVP